ncbi:tetratricopeptide repeat protein [Streptomyces gardneri]|uniref:tetratricopeptide repeat protein n=1 Tax=Streptomyces gardneri TaxID=66892 RepID=UPI0036C54C08
MAGLNMPSHRDQDLNELEFESVDTRFKRFLALAVALIALFGAILGYAASHAGAREDAAAREAQRNAILAMSQQSAAQAKYYDRLGGFTAVTAVKQRLEIADTRANLLSIPGESVNTDHWRENRDRLKDLSPETQEATGTRTSVTAWADASVKPTLARLRQEASRSAAADWGNKASAYVGGITLLAISLALLGLSTTITPGNRRLFWWPAAGITLVTLVGFLIIAGRPVSHIPEAAMKDIVKGDRHLALGDHEKAMSFYTQAIQKSEKYAAAYQRRADARAASESPGSGYVVDVISRKAREANIADLDRVIEFGGENFVNLNNQGANYFYLQEYRKMEELIRRAIALNDDLPLPRMNLALALAGQGRAKAAEREFRQAVTLFEKRSLQERTELYASARTVLETLILQRPDRHDLARRLQGVLVEAEAAALTQGSRIPAHDASVPQLGLVLDGSKIHIPMKYQNIPENAWVSKIIYYRQDASKLWDERIDLGSFERFKLPADGGAIWDPYEFQCQPAGEYRVDVYVNDRRLASAPTTRRSVWENLETHYDPVGNFALCRPAGWKFSTNDAGRVDLESLDGEQRLKVLTVPLPLPVDAAKTSEVALARLAGPLHNEAVRTSRTLEDEIGGLSGTRDEYEMADGRRAGVWAALPADGVLRTVVVEYRGSQQNEQIQELLRRIKFIS